MFSQTITIHGHVSININCSQEEPIFSWTGYTINEETADESKNPSIVSSGSVSIRFEKNNITAALYKLTLKVSIKGMEGAFISDHMYIRFKNHPLVAKIEGGIQRYVTFGQNITINAESFSYDPVQNIQGHLTFVWKCRSMNVSKNDTKVQQYLAEPLEPIDTWGESCSIDVPDDGSVTVNTLDLGEDIWVFFEVTVRKMDRNATAMQGLFIEGGNPLILIIKCERNCGRKMAANIKLTLVVECQNNSEIDGLTYHWKLFQYKSSLKEYEEENDLESMTDSGIHIDNIGMKNNVLLEGEIYRFDVLVKKAGDTNVNTQAGKASYMIFINQPPYGGKCTSSPIVGNAGTTDFTITCTGWKDEGFRDQQNENEDTDEALSYKFTQIRNAGINETVTSMLVESTVKFVRVRLSLGEIEYEYRTYVLVRIRDIYSGYIDWPVSITVKPFLNMSLTGQVDISSVDDFADIAGSELGVALKTNDPSVIMQTGAAVISNLINLSKENRTEFISEDGSQWSAGTLDAIPGSNRTYTYKEIFSDVDNLGKQTEIEIVLTKLVENVTQVILNTLENVKDTLTTLSVIEAFASSIAVCVSYPHLVNNNTQIQVSNSLDTLASSFYIIANDANKAAENFEQTALTITVLVSRLQESLVPDGFTENVEFNDVTDMETARLVVKNMASLGGDKNAVLVEDGDITGDERTFFLMRLAMVKQYKILEQKKVAASSTFLLESAQGKVDSVMSNNTCRGCKTNLTSANMQLLIKKLPKVVIQNQSIIIRDQTVDINGVGDDEGNTVVTASVIQYKKNIFMYDKQHDSCLISTPIVKILVGDQDGKPVSIKGITYKQDISSQIMMTHNSNPSFLPEDESKLFYHRYYYRATGDSLCINIATKGDIDKYTVYIRKDNFPTHLEYDYKTEARKDRDWTVCIPPAAVKDKGIAYMGLKPHVNIKALGNGKRKKRAADENTITSIQELSPYSLGSVTVACKTWNEKKSQWENADCELTVTFMPMGTGATIECTCRPSTDMIYGTTFFVPPNTIDFSSVFLVFSPHDQAAILAVLVIVVCIYILLILWARFHDRKDLLKWGVTPLSDNFVEDTYYYLLTVHTGMRRSAGTKSRVAFTMAGDRTATGVRELSDGIRKGFFTGSVMHFVMATPEPLGEIDYMRIWHDNSGDEDAASWYLDKIEVEDIQTKDRYVFLCNDWLAVEEGDGSLDRLLPVCVKDNIMTFKNIFFTNAKDNLSESHIWISIIYRPTSSHFTRVQRVSCALVFLMLTMIANAIAYKPTDRDNYIQPDIVHIGPFSFTTSELYLSLICAIITLPPTFLVIILFKKSKPHVKQRGCGKEIVHAGANRVDNWFKKRYQQSVELEKRILATNIAHSENTLLPHWMVYVTWVIVFLASAIPGFFLLLYSMEWGKQTSEEWLTSFLLSFFEATFFLDPLKVVLLAAVFAMLLKSDKVMPTKLDRELVLNNYGSSSHTGGYRLPAPPLCKPALEKAKEARKWDLKMQGAIKDMLSNFLFLWIIYSISYSNRDINSYSLYQDVHQQLITPNTGMGFMEITTTKDFFTWLNDTALPVLFPSMDFDDKPTTWRWREYFSGYASYRLGPPRLKLSRMQEESCDVPYLKEIPCFSKYDMINEDTDDYCIGWKSPPCLPTEHIYKYSSGAWKHTNAIDIWGIPTPGLYNTYSGGGYLAELGVNLQVSMVTLEELFQNFWINRETRSVIFEFTLYCANLNLYLYNTFIVEFPETGGVIPHYVIMPLRLHQHVGTRGSYVLFCEIVFILFLIVHATKVFWRIYKEKKKYFKQVWNSLDFIWLIGCIVAIIMYTIRYIAAEDTMDSYLKDHKKFVNFQHIANWDFLFNLLMGLLVFQATVHLLYVAGYSQRMSILAKVFVLCAMDLLWYGLFFCYILFGYATFGWLLFGSSINSYMNILAAIETLFISMIGKSRFNEISENHRGFAQFYFFVFVVAIVFVLLTIFLAILCESINEVHQQMKISKSEELVDYLLNKFKKLVSYGTDKSHNSKGNLPLDRMKTNEPFPPAGTSTETMLMLAQLRQDMGIALSNISGQEKMVKNDYVSMTDVTVATKTPNKAQPERYGSNRPKRHARFRD